MQKKINRIGVNYNLCRGYCDRLIQYGQRYRKPIRIIAMLLWMVIIAAIFWNAWHSRNQLMPYLSQMNPLILIWVVFYYLIALVFTLLSWVSIMRLFAPDVSFLTHVRIFMATMAARRLPGTIWYVGGRVILYKSFGISQIKTASASGIELVVSFIANCIIAIIVLPFGLELDPILILPLYLGAVGGVLLLHPSNIAKIMHFLRRPLEAEINLRQLLIWLLLRIGVVISGSIMVAQTLRIFQPLETHHYPIILGARALSGAASMLTYFLPNSFGASDITLAVVLSRIMPVTIAALLALTVRILTTTFEVIFAVVFNFIIKQPVSLRDLSGFK